MEHSQFIKIFSKYLIKYKVLYTYTYVHSCYSKDSSLSYYYYCNKDKAITFSEFLIYDNFYGILRKIKNKYAKILRL